MPVDQKRMDRVELARRLAFVLNSEIYRLFGPNFDGSPEDPIDRLLSVSERVDPAVYSLAFMLKTASKKPSGE